MSRAKDQPDDPPGGPATNSGRISDERMARIIEGTKSPAVHAATEQAPIPPDDALELLRATGCPIGRGRATDAT